MSLNLIHLLLLTCLLIGAINADPQYYYNAPQKPIEHEPRTYSYPGKGIYDFLFGPYPRRPNNQRPSYNRPVQDFANDKVPDYDLYLAG